MGQALHPVLPDGAVPLVVEVGDPVRRPHQRRTVAHGGVGEPLTVRGAAEPDSLLELPWRGLGPGRDLGAGPGRCGRDPDVGHPAVAAAVDGLDDVLADAVVAQHPPGGLDPAGQRRLADEAVAPDGVEQLGLGDDPRAVRDEVAQHVEDLGLHVLRLPTALEQEPVGVEDDVPERVPHGGNCDRDGTEGTWLPPRPTGPPPVSRAAPRRSRGLLRDVGTPDGTGVVDAVPAASVRPEALPPSPRRVCT